jgi:cysteine-rich repeat protein
MDEAACNMDCTVAACGDGYVNAAAGEECDDQNMEIVDDCTPQCRATVFWDDMALDPMLGSQWLMPEIPEYEYMGAPFSVAAGWQWGSAEPGTWWSGPYSDSSGTARLITRPIEFPEPGRGFRYELRLRHRLRFDGNVDDVGGCGESTSDGGVVWIMDMPMGMLRPAGPPMGAGQAVLENAGECSLALMMPDNPLFDPAMPRPAYSGITAFVDTGFPLPLDVAGTTVQLVFEISYDCANCWSAGVPLDAGWTIDHVVVAAFPV